MRARVCTVSRVMCVKDCKELCDGRDVCTSVNDSDVGFLHMRGASVSGFARDVCQVRDCVASMALLERDR